MFVQMARPRGLLTAFGPSSQAPMFSPLAGSLRIEPIRGSRPHRAVLSV